MLDRADYTICLMSDLSHPPDLSHLLDVFSLAVRKSGELLLKVMWRLFLCGACVLCRTPRVLHVVLSSVTERCPAQGTRQSCCMWLVPRRGKKKHTSAVNPAKKGSNTLFYSQYFIPRANHDLSTDHDISIYLSTYRLVPHLPL